MKLVTFKNYIKVIPEEYQLAASDFIKNYRPNQVFYWDPETTKLFESNDIDNIDSCHVCGLETPHMWAYRNGDGHNVPVCCSCSYKLDGTGSKEQNAVSEGDKVKRHAEICHKLNGIYASKNSDYGDSFGKLRKELPDAILVRVYDKYSRLKTLLSGKEQKVKTESIDDTLLDLANYCIMELVERGLDKK